MTQPISKYVTCLEPDWGTVQTCAHDLDNCTGVTIVRAYVTTDEGTFGVREDVVSAGVDAGNISYIVGLTAEGADALRVVYALRFGKLSASLTFECELHTAAKKAEAETEADPLEDTAESLLAAAGASKAVKKVGSKHHGSRGR